MRGRRERSFGPLTTRRRPKASLIAIRSCSTGSTVTTTYAWDSNGNLKAKQGPGEYTGYIFDADNRLVEVKRGATEAMATTVAKYGYDADGQRISKTTANGTTLFLIDPTTTWAQVALESQGSQRTAYVWAEQLRQQTKGSAGALATTPSDDLVPLQGHLGTTIAAIGRSGNVVEDYEATAFGVQQQNTRAQHLFTGEYWDQDGKPLYLRARWYDSATGRFISEDWFEGRQSDPRSLNRYTYAHAEPVGNSDPSGGFSMGEVGSAMNMAGTMASRAYSAYDLISLLFPPEEAPLDGRPSLYEMLVSTTLKAVATASSADPTDLGVILASTALMAVPSQGHHTIPVYMCGGRVQEVVDIGIIEHSVLHAQLLGFVRAINIAGVVSQILGSRRARGALKPPLYDVARTPYGRQAIAAGLSAFYQLGGMGGRTWASLGRGRESGHKMLFVLMM
jgi:RHS repeat-associated protein